MIAWFLAAMLEAQPAPQQWARLPACASASAPITAPCTLPLGLTPEQATLRIAGKAQVAWIEQDRLTMIARPTVERWALLCCTVSTPLDPIAGTELAGVTVRVPRLDEAVLAIRAVPAKDETPLILRGRNAPPPPPTRAPPPARLIRAAIDSAALGERRGITLYLPPGLGPNDRPPILYLADNAAEAFAPIAEALIRAGRAGPVILVGIDAAKSSEGCLSPSCDRRGKEYKIDFNADGAAPDSDFGRHLRFVTDELIPYVEQRHGGPRDAATRGIGGWSNGAHWALSVAGLRPDLFGRVLALSSSARDAAGLGAKLGHAQLFAGAGVYEADYLKQTIETARAAAGAGARIRTTSVVAGHERLAWRMMFAQALPWLAPATAKAAKPRRRDT